MFSFKFTWERQLIFPDLKYESATISLGQLQKESSNLNESFTFHWKNIS